MRANNRVVTFWLFLFTFSIYCLVASGHYGGDAINNYFTTESIVLDKNINIINKNISLSEIKTGDAIQISGNESNRYSPFGIGMPILQTPFFIKGLVLSRLFKDIPQQHITFFSVSFTNSFMSALNTALLYLIMLVLGFRKKRAICLAIVYSFSTMAIVYSKTGFVEPAMATFLLLSMLALFLYFDGQKKILLIITSGAALGFAGLIKNYTILLLPFFVVYIFVKKEKSRWKTLAAFLMSFGAVFSIDLWFNYIRYGGMLKSGYGDITVVGLGYGHHFIKGFYYYWLSSGKGFFFYNAPLLLALFVWRGLYAKKRAEFWLIISLIMLYVLYFAYFFKRGSIFSWGPRYLFPIVPLFMLLMDGVFAKKKLIVLLVILAIAGAIIQFPALIMNYSKYIYFIKQKLGLEEYLINFIPDLSHIKGCWQLLISFITRTISGIEQIFTYSPDPLFVKPISCVMSGYDAVDLWYINIMKLKQSFKPMIFLCIGILGIIIILSGSMLFKKIKYLK